MPAGERRRNHVHLGGKAALLAALIAVSFVGLAFGTRPSVRLLERPTSKAWQAGQLDSVFLERGDDRRVTLTSSR